MDIQLSIMPMILAVQAAAATTSLQRALSELCMTSKSFLGLIMMLFFVVSVPILIIGAALYFLKKEDKNLRLAGMVLLGLGGLGAVLGIIGLVVYLLIPLLIGSLLGGGANFSC